jgi:hypothetical protein
VQPKERLLRDGAGDFAGPASRQFQILAGLPLHFRYWSPWLLVFLLLWLVGLTAFASDPVGLIARNWVFVPIGMAGAAFMAAREAAAGGGGMTAHFSTLLFLACGVVIGIPALMIACSRHFAADTSRNEVCRIFQIGPFKWRRSRELSGFSLVEVRFEADSGQDGPGTYIVRLAGPGGADAMAIANFDAALPANTLARDLGAALGLPSKDAPSKFAPRTAQS